ncbi:MAG TPA: DNA methyltransferase [Methylocella sp.]|nr:DNA methyltransferase [Methylocella sp.]
MPAAADLDSFISRWTQSGGAERANYAPFLCGLCDVLGVPQPDPASHDAAANAYAFERAVTFREADGSAARGRIDLYKRGCFVLEAKQSRRPGTEKAQQSNLFDAEPEDTTPLGKRTASRAWNVLMLNARQQAEHYAKALPAAEGWPPFLIVCDVGHCFEIYADFSGQGKNYAQFPDRQGYRIFLEELRKDDTRSLLRDIWLEPTKRDPAKIAAKATRAIAERLAKVSKYLEGQNNDPEQVALFLMRCLFTMFAEDVGLLPKASFRDVLKKCAEKPELFPRLVGQLWEAMDRGGFAYAIEGDVKQFNGYLFKNRTVLPLPRQEIGELYEAAKANWREVEPAIFGTLLEQALDPAERKKLGAHYTPRAYVERLVTATILEPLKEEWANVQAAAEGKRVGGDTKGAAALVREFHTKLCGIRILDPACGTGNFLYVALELMKRLEGEVLEALASLSAQERFSGYELKTIDPHQFLGLEINPRAAAIAELVLWIGYLQWHSRTRGGMPPEPILRDFKTIEVRDAVLAYDAKELARDDRGKPITRRDPNGQEIEVYRYKNPKRPEWPQADYIVGNPPFIGGKDIRGRLGEDYAKALWAVHPHMNESADFVMYWWDHAAEFLTRKGTRLQRFGLVTTNSLSQVFQRRVVEKHLKAKEPVSLVMTIPDHPWTKATKDAAAVRIAMTVARGGQHEGRLYEVIKEEGLDTDAPNVELRETIGPVNSDLTVGVDVTVLPPLQANEFLVSRGVQLIGEGFILTPSEAEHRGLGRRPGLENHIRHYRNGRDLTGTPRGLMVIDLFGLEAEDVRKRFPEVYQHVLATVKESTDEDGRPNGRDVNNRESYKLNWWIFGEPRRELRPALAGLARYIATVETSKHRFFQFLDASILPDNMLVCMALDDAFFLGVLSSRLHVVWALSAGGTLEDRPRYTKGHCFDPFPFPDSSESLKARIRNTAEELDALRKRQQAEHPGLTLTQIYNVLEKLPAGEELLPQEEVIKTKGLVLILKELHDKLDALVAEAYGWPKDLSDQEVLARLVALNAERAAEEKRGLVRWLRPGYQRAKAGVAAPPSAAPEQYEAELPVTEAAEQKPLFPAGDLERAAAVYAALAAASAPLDAAALAAGFRQGRKVEAAISRVLNAFARIGQFFTPDGARFSLRRSA